MFSKDGASHMNARAILSNGRESKEIAAERCAYTFFWTTQYIKYERKVLMYTLYEPSLYFIFLIVFESFSSEHMFLYDYLNNPPSFLTNSGFMECNMC
jgi:hypothetical protein